MAITISAPLQKVTPGDTNDHEVTFGNFGQGQRLSICIEVTSGTISFNVNGLGASGQSFASGAKVPPFELRDKVDVLHVDAASGTDSFVIGVSSAK